MSQLDRLTFGSLFAGIGGLDLGLERAGMSCQWQVEIDDYATRVLAKHWPNVPRFRDVRSVGAHNLPSVDLICGGFPCQDISNAGKRAGIDGKRSGLWREFYRIICELRPRYVLVENVAALLHRGLGRVLGDLAALGYDAEWSVFSACALGAPHTRERLFIIAHPSEQRTRVFATSTRLPPIQAPQYWESFRKDDLTSCLAPYSIDSRNADGVPYRVERLRGLGNAVVPQVAEFIGKLIVAHAKKEYSNVPA